MSTDTPPAAPAASSATEDNTVALVCYLTFIGFIIAIVMHNGKKTKLGAYHLRQMLGLILTGIVCWPLNMILAFIPILGWACMFAIFVCLVVLWVMGLISAVNRQMKPVPVVGPLYQKWFGTAFD
jgi:uncharacterized membrane protein